MYLSISLDGITQTRPELLLLPLLLSMLLLLFLSMLLLLLNNHHHHHGHWQHLIWYSHFSTHPLVL